MLRISRLTAIALLVLSPSVASADTLLASFDFWVTVATSEVEPQFKPFTSYGDPLPQPSLGYLGDVTLTMLDFFQGNTYELQGDFANFSSLATNGVDNSIYVGAEIVSGGISWAQQSESSLLSTSFLAVPGLGTPDFSGYDVTRVMVLGTSYSAGPIYTDASINFQVYGDRLVPEPGSWALLALGACALVGYGRTRRRRS